MPGSRITPLSVVLLAVAALLCSGCEQIQSLLGKDAGGGPEVRLVNAFAVVDLDEIARRLGRDEALRQALQSRQNQLSGNLSDVRNQYLQQARAFQEELGQDPSQEEQQRLANLVTEMNTKLTQLQQQAAASLTQEQINLIRQFRNEVRPVAMDVAASRGFNTILIKNEDLVFAYHPASDITEEVIQRMGTPMVP